MTPRRLVAAGLLAALAGPAQAGTVQADPAEANPMINSLPELTRAITACWHPPRAGDDITLRLSFRRDGTIFGRPRIVHLHAVRGADGEAELATSVYTAIAACRPYRLTPAFGGAIAGQVLLLRFFARARELHA